MRQSQIFFSALHFFLLTVLSLCGICSIILFFSPLLKHQVAAWIANDQSWALIIWGGGLFLFAILLIMLSTRLYRTQYYQIQMGASQHIAQVDLDLIRSLVGRYWQHHFPVVSNEVDVLIHQDATLELLAELPLQSLTDNKELLQQIEGDLSRELACHLGYRKPFFLTIKSSKEHQN
jgi:ABC-type transport system involved in multi-copper enzyme maturation permease subunit